MKQEEIAGDLLKKNNYRISIAESCTGGLISHRITNIPGSSDWFDRGFIVYSNEAKQELLGVTPETIKTFGAVSEQTAGEMAQGARKKANTDIGLAVTGIAGPGGETTTKPIGLVYIAISSRLKNQCKKFLYQGTREEIKRETSDDALNLLIEILKEISLKSEKSLNFFI